MSYRFEVPKRTAKVRLPKRPRKKARAVLLVSGPWGRHAIEGLANRATAPEILCERLEIVGIFTDDVGPQFNTGPAGKRFWAGLTKLAHNHPITNPDGQHWEKMVERKFHDFQSRGWVPKTCSFVCEPWHDPEGRPVFDWISALDELEPDIIICSAFGGILPWEAILKYPFFLVFHPGAHLSNRDNPRKNLSVGEYLAARYLGKGGPETIRDDILSGEVDGLEVEGGFQACLLGLRPADWGPLLGFGPTQSIELHRPSKTFHVGEFREGILLKNLARVMERIGHATAPAVSQLVPYYAFLTNKRPPNALVDREKIPELVSFGHGLDLYRRHRFGTDGVVLGHTECVDAFRKELAATGQS